MSEPHRPGPSNRLHPGGTARISPRSQNHARCALDRLSDHHEPNARLSRTAPADSYRDAGVAEWISSGLQSRVHGFESRHSLQLSDVVGDDAQVGDKRVECFIAVLRTPTQNGRRMHGCDHLGIDVEVDLSGTPGKS